MRVRVRDRQSCGSVYMLVTVPGDEVYRSAWAHSPSTAAALASVGAADEHVLERGEATLGIVPVFLHA